MRKTGKEKPASRAIATRLDAAALGPASTRSTPPRTAAPHRSPLRTRRPARICHGGFAARAGPLDRSTVPHTSRPDAPVGRAVLCRSVTHQPLLQGCASRGNCGARTRCAPFPRSGRFAPSATAPRRASCRPRNCALRASSVLRRRRALRPRAALTSHCAPARNGAAEKTLRCSGSVPLRAALPRCAPLRRFALPSAPPRFVPPRPRGPPLSLRNRRAPRATPLPLRPAPPNSKPSFAAFSRAPSRRRRSPFSMVLDRRKPRPWTATNHHL